MLAMMQYFIAHDLIDHEWIAAQTHGFDELATHVADWTPDRAAAICGIETTQIERLAHDYGTIRPA
ncbi:hypothetical protein V6O07_08260, partial [Arthrospira platensis SPKY2]